MYMNFRLLEILSAFRQGVIWFQEWTILAFFLRVKKEGLAAGREAVRTYYQFEGKKLDDFCKENVDPAWEHFDVNKDGFIDMERGPQFLRFIIKNPEFSFGI